MAFKDDLFKNLTAEQRTAIEDSVGDDFDWDLVPRSRLNKVIGQRNDLRKQLGQPSNPKKKSDGNSDDDDDATYYTKEDVDKMLADKQKEFDDANSAKALREAVVNHLKSKKVKDPEILLNAGLIDLEKASVDKDGKVTGIDDTIKALETSHNYLFEDVQTGTGKDGDGAGSGKKGSEIDDKLDALFAEFSAPSDN